MTARAATASRFGAQQAQRDNLKKLVRKKRPSVSVMRTAKADRIKISRVVRR
jgi:hypothetical protein